MRNWPWRYDIVHDLKARVPKALEDDWEPPDYKFTISPSFKNIETFFNSVEKHARKREVWLSEDIETANDHITCVGFAWSNTEAICIPFTCSSGPYWNEEEEIQIVLALRRMHQLPNVKIIGMNFLYDAQYNALYHGYTPPLRRGRNAPPPPLLAREA